MPPPVLDTGDSQSLLSAENVAEKGQQWEEHLPGLSPCWPPLCGEPEIATQVPQGSSAYRHGSQGVTALLPLELSTQETMGLVPPLLTLP